MQVTQCPPSPSQNEWLKILASAFAGLFAGLIADPIKAKLERSTEQRRIWKALMLDLSTLDAGLMAARAGLMTREEYWGAIAVPAYEHYWETKRELFYDSLELQAVRFHCQSILRAKEKVQSLLSDPNMADAINVRSALMDMAESNLHKTLIKARSLKRPTCLPEWLDKLLNKILS